MSNEITPTGEAPLFPALNRPDRRMSRRYRFFDPDMDLFFMSALSWGPSGGLDIGQASYIATRIKDGDADSWVASFADYGDVQMEQADQWAAKGWQREAGEARVKAFASYRSAWQFADAGQHQFMELYGRHQAAFQQAMEELKVPTQPMSVSYQGRKLPGLYLPGVPGAVTVLIVGGADTCTEDLFLTAGRSLWDRGYSVAMVDLPGQGRTALDGLYWETEPEHAISAVVTALINDHKADSGRIVLLGLSLGGYFVCRAAGRCSHLGAVIASTPFPRPGELFSLTVERAMLAGESASLLSTATTRSRKMAIWKSGARSPAEFVARWVGAFADPEIVKIPFLSIVGLGDSEVFQSQAEDWHNRIQSPRKSIVRLDASTGADAHCQVNSRSRLIQEAAGWISEVFPAHL